MDERKMPQLIAFHGEAAKAAYAGSSGEAGKEERGFIELEYKAGDFFYRDSYTGFLRSWGQEVIYLGDEVVWTSLYGGGMEPGYTSREFALRTFSFLKEALSCKEETSFSPRGPDAFSREEWRYACAWQGDMKNFSGSEFITYEGQTVFRHQFIGGVVLGEEKTD